MRDPNPLPQITRTVAWAMCAQEHRRSRVLRVVSPLGVAGAPPSTAERTTLEGAAPAAPPGPSRFSLRMVKGRLEIAVFALNTSAATAQLSGSDPYLIRVQESTAPRAVNRHDECRAATSARTYARVSARRNALIRFGSSYPCESVSIRG